MNKRAVALYMRLSREDGKAGGDGFKRDESNSIGNQRKLLLDFLKKGQEFAMVFPVPDLKGQAFYE